MNCLPWSVAQVTGIDYEILIKEIGHDGSEILFPELPPPACHRAFHPQEIIIPLLNLGFIASYIERRPVFSEGYDLPEQGRAIRDLAMAGNKGVFFGYNAKGLGHAVGWDGNRLIDSQNQITSLGGLGDWFAFMLIRRI